MGVIDDVRRKDSDYNRPSALLQKLSGHFTIGCLEDALG